MNKILILLILIINLSGCYKSEINASIYISSIGFEIEDDDIVCYFLSNPLNNISRNSNDKNSDSEYVKVKAKSIDDAFKEAEKTTLSPLNYRHIKSVIFHKDVFKTTYIEHFFRFMRAGVYVTYNYYVFATEDKIEDIISFKNPEQISYQHSILSSPNLIEFEKYGLEQMHFLDFANDYYDEKRFLHIPLIETSKVWNENTTLLVSGYLACGINITAFKNKKYIGIMYLSDQELSTFYTPNATYRIMDYNVSFKEEGGKFSIFAEYKDVHIFGFGSKDELNYELTKEIKKYLDDYISKEGSLYLINEYNYLNKKALDVLSYNVNIKNIK